MSDPATREEIEAAVEAAIVNWLRKKAERVSYLSKLPGLGNGTVAVGLRAQEVGLRKAADAIERRAHRENRDGE